VEFNDFLKQDKLADKISTAEEYVCLESGISSINWTQDGDKIQSSKCCVLNKNQDRVLNKSREMRNIQDYS
jgi:hypothetical protein